MRGASLWRPSGSPLPSLCGVVQDALWSWGSGDGVVVSDDLGLLGVGVEADNVRALRLGIFRGVIAVSSR